MSQKPYQTHYKKYHNNDNQENRMTDSASISEAADLSNNIKQHQQQLHRKTVNQKDLLVFTLEIMIPT